MALESACRVSGPKYGFRISSLGFGDSTAIGWFIKGLLSMISNVGVQEVNSGE